MDGSTIRGTILSTVTLGRDGYVSPLTITSTGAVTPDLSATAIVVPADLPGATIFNHGAIVGGSGQIGQAVRGGTGLNAAGDDALIKNTGTIQGGNGSASHSFGGGGGDAVRLASGGYLLNTGVISGGNGAVVGHGSSRGGAGVYCEGTAKVSNAGQITGGGGDAGGTGVLLDGGTLVNRGGISAGSGAAQPGVGVLVNGGTVVTSGTISGGGGPKGVIGDAVEFRAAGTLIVEPGVVFNGDVSAPAPLSYALELDGKSLGTISGLGSQFKDFSTLTEAAGADWTVTDINDLKAASLLDYGTLSVAGTLANASGATIGRHGSISVVTDGAVQVVGDLVLSGGTLSGSATGTVAIGSRLHYARAGMITVRGTGAAIGFGTMGGAPIADAGSIVAQGGTLTLQDGVSGAGTLLIESAAVLRADAALGVRQMVFAAGGDARLVLAAPTQDSATQYGFGSGDVIDLLQLKATSLEFQNGTLTLENGGKIVDTLLFDGSYVAHNFVLSPDHHGGTDVNFVANAARAPAAWETSFDIRAVTPLWHFASG